MPDIEAVLLDLDDTLMPVKPRKDLDPIKQISLPFTQGLEELRAIVRGSQENGIKIAICSARERFFCRCALAMLGIPDGVSVVESGVGLFNAATEEFILHPLLTPTTKDIFQKVYREKIKQFCESHPEIKINLYEGPEVNISLELKKDSSVTIPQLAKTIQELLDGSSPPIDIQEFSVAVDISPAGINKGSGVRFYSQHTGIPLNKILAVGDSRGDFPVLELVGFIGCPQNADNLCKALVRERGGRVSDFYYAQGVADIIRHFTGTSTN